MSKINKYFTPNSGLGLLFLTLVSVLKVHNRVSARGAGVISTKTSKERHKVLHMFFRFLYVDKKNKLKDVRNLKQKHVKMLIDDWVEKKLCPATIQTYFSILKTFVNWIGKPELVTKLSDYIDDPKIYTRKYTVTKSKAWSDNGVDPVEKVCEIASYDPNVAIQMLMALYFGLRREESAKYKPFVAEQEKALLINYGTKGGRQRPLSIDSDAQHEVLCIAKMLAENKNASLIPSKYKYKQWDKHFQYVLNKFGINKKDLGVTFHGLRHEYTLYEYENITKMLAAIRQKGSRVTKPDPELEEYARSVVANKLGHVRPSITNAYIGGKIHKSDRDVNNSPDKEIDQEVDE